MTNDYKEKKELMELISAEQEYEKQTLKNDFIFGKVMQDKGLCTEMLGLLTGNRIENVESINSQKSLKVTSDSRGVRYDIYVEADGDNVYDAEMQRYYDNASKDELPKRSRYYQGMIDLNLLESGGSFKDLKNSYVVFICTFDPFDEDLCCYRFENMNVDERKVLLGDGRTILFFNTKGKFVNVTEEVKEFLDYLEKDKVTNDFTKRLDEAVKGARHNKEWKVEYMKSLLYEMEIRERATREGLAAGMAQGLEQGIAQGLEQGLQQGLQQGLEQGRVQGLAVGILEILTDYGEVSDGLKETITSEKDLEILKKWNKLSAKVSTVEEFVQKMSL